MSRRNLTRATFVAVFATGALMAVTPTASAAGQAVGQVVPVTGEGDYVPAGSSQLATLKVYLDGRVTYTLDGGTFSGKVTGSAVGNTATLTGTVSTGTLSGVAAGDDLDITIVDNGSGGGSNLGPDTVQVEVFPAGTQDLTFGDATARYLEKGNFTVR